MIEWIHWFVTTPIPYALSFWVMGMFTGYCIGWRHREISRKPRRR